MNDELTGWQSIETAPRNASNVILRVPCKRLHPDHREVIAHWAEDMSGEEQPPYKGWFYDDGRDFSAVTPEPTHWRPFPAVNALPELVAEIEVLRCLAPQYFRWTGDIDQTDDPVWACDKLKYGGAHFENIGTPEVRFVVYDDQDRRWVAERGDYIVEGETGLWVLPARAALKETGQ